jgi:DNA-binding HxlR family transcriptional regulator
MERKNSSARNYTCSFEYTIDMISGRWKSRILWYLGEGTLRYSELRRKLSPITQKMLTQSLRELEENTLVIRTVYPVVPPKVEYSLTEEGRELIPIFNMLHDWGRKVGSQKGLFTECTFAIKEVE